MSELVRNSDTGRDQPAHIELVEDAESAWLRARLRDPAAAPPSPGLASAHARLEESLGDLPSIRVDDSWHDEVLRAAISAHGRAMRGWAAAALGLAAVVGATVLWSALPAREPELAMKILPGHGNTRGGEQAMVGDHLVVRARADAASELLVYRDGVVVLARCPGDPRCTPRTDPARDQHIELTLDVPGVYNAILIVNPGVALPVASSMDALLVSVRAANARMMLASIVVH